MSEVGRYRKLYVRLWRHPGFAGLSEGERLFALYILGGPQSNRLGLYMLSLATAAEDLGTTVETLKKRLPNISETFGWMFDATARVVYLPSWWRWNPPENANVLKGSLKDLNELPPCGLIDAFAANIATLDETLHETFLRGIRQRLPKPSTNQNQGTGTGTGSRTEHEQKGPALRALPETQTPIELNSAILEIAKGVRTHMPRDQDTDYLIDAVQYEARKKHMPIDRPTAIAALAASR